MSAIPIGTTITTAHDPRTDDVETTITVEMTAVTAIAMTETTIMIVMTMIKMIGMIEGTPVTIGATTTATPATIGETTTTDNAMAIPTINEITMHLGPTHRQT